MKKDRLLIMLLFISMMLFSENSWGETVVAWDMDGNQGDELTMDATTNAEGLVQSVLSRGEGINENTLSNAFSSNSFTSEGDKQNALDNDEYLEFEIEVEEGYKVSLRTIDANFRRSDTGPDTFIWQYSFDNFDSDGVDIGSEFLYTGTEDIGEAQDQIDLTDISDLQNIEYGDVITFRLYAWGAEGTAGTFAIGRLDDVDLAVGGFVNEMIQYASTDAEDFDITVELGTSEQDAENQLASTVGITGTEGEEGEAVINWSIENYDGNIADEYTATGELSLPEGWFGDPDDVTAVVTVMEGITSVNKPKDVEVSVFPNPASEVLNVESSEVIKNIRLTDISGKIVKYVIVDSTGARINLSNMEAGIYLMEMQTAEGVSVERVQVVR